MTSLRLIAFDGGGALCLFLRLGGVSRVLVDCGCPSPAAPLTYLRELGEVDALHPLSRHLRPAGLGGREAYWLGVLGLVRGLALRPGGSWVFWSSLPHEGPGFSLRATVLTRQEVPEAPQLDFFEPPLLALGLTGRQVAELAGGPAGWVAASSPLCALPRLPGQGGDLLVSGDLPRPLWRRLLGGAAGSLALAGASVFSATPATGDGGVSAWGRLLERGLILGLLPWLVLGGFCPGSAEGLRDGDVRGRPRLRTPAVGSLTIDAGEDGALLLTARPRAGNLLVWSGSARPVGRPGAPAVKTGR
jgi:hypothetical protein